MVPETITGFQTGKPLGKDSDQTSLRPRSPVESLVSPPKTRTRSVVGSYALPKLSRAGGAPPPVASGDHSSVGASASDQVPLDVYPCAECPPIAMILSRTG